jgi:hypothetical protein
MLISKMQTYPRDKMLPKKVKIKKRKKMGLSKFIIQFFNFNFFGTFCHQDKFAFLNSVLNSRFFDTLYDLFQEKKFHLPEELISKFINTKIKKR